MTMEHHVEAHPIKVHEGYWGLVDKVDLDNFLIGQQMNAIAIRDVEVMIEKQSIQLYPLST